MYVLYARLYQQLHRLFSKFVKWPHPVLYTGEGSLSRIPSALPHDARILLVIGDGLHGTEGEIALKQVFQDASVSYATFEVQQTNPTLNQVENCVERYTDENCQALVAFGGGSAIDVAKLAAAGLSRPKKSLRRMRGLLKVRLRNVPLLAVPTTMGSGSEVSLTAVVTDVGRQRKFTVNDPALVPDAVFLDPLPTMSLPDSLVASSGLDALSHAIEAYLNRHRPPECIKAAKEAVGLVFKHLEESLDNPRDFSAREGMLMAAYQAGLAFRKAYVGNIHAMSHALSARHDLPHGITNGVLLPIVLRYYGQAVHQRLAELAVAADLPVDGLDTTNRAEAFIEAVDGLRERLGLPERLRIGSRPDTAFLTRHAKGEANPLYPVPVIFKKSDFTYLFDFSCKP